MRSDFMHTTDREFPGAIALAIQQCGVRDPDRSRASGVLQSKTHRSPQRAAVQVFADRRPDSLTAMHSSGIAATSSSDVSTRTSSVCKSRLFTPTMRAPAASARRVLRRVNFHQRFHSELAAQRQQRRSSSGASAATISRNESALAARASHTCHGSTIKSLRNTGSRCRRPCIPQ